MSDTDPFKLVVIGGGTGSFALLGELKKLTPNITAIVNMSDDGGSTGVLRDELGVLPPGDARQCLVALSESDEIRNLFSYRFSDGRFEGHSIGNIILSALELQHGSFGEAIRVASDILNITGKVVPVTFDKSTLVMVDGAETISGEHLIGHHPISNRNALLSLSPKAQINPDATLALAAADLIVIAPGNLYGSLLPIFTVGGFSEAMRDSSAKIVCVTNLVTKPGQTDGWHVVDFVKEFERYLGEDQIDIVLYNDTPISDELLNRYAEDGEYPVGTAEYRFNEVHIEAMPARLVSKEIAQQDPNDKAIRRTLIRHDGHQVGVQLLKILSS
jgi:uncharacterized cofD-like protein